jgi:hypothetical protein
MPIQGPLPAQFQLNVLGYREDGLWYAHALEMDIVGTGSTFEAACEELDSLVKAQANYAAYKGDPSLLWHPAPMEIVQKFYELFIRGGAGEQGEVLASIPVERQASLTQNYGLCSHDA